MDAIISFLRSDVFGVVVVTTMFISISLLVYLLIKMMKLNKKYQEFISKFEDGKDFEGMMRNYLKDVAEIKSDNSSIINFCKEIENNMSKCIQKIGMIRYSAFQNTGSDLCFALALLDFEDTGVIINGIYSRDNTTTTYAKPIEKGVSKYTLVKEEEEALEIAKHNGYKYYININ